jgi:uncharacterized small protein (DUF1192 family)
MMETMYSLTQDYKELLNLAGSMDADEIETFNNTLEAVLGEIEVKADGYAVVLAEIEGRINTVNREIGRLEAIESALSNTRRRMIDRLKTAMEDIGKKEIKTDLHRFKIVGNGGKQPLDINEGCVPEEYLKTEVKQVPDKDKIRKALASGECLTFAHLEDRGTHLNID